MTFLKQNPDADLKEVLKNEAESGVPLALYHEAILRGNSSPFEIGLRELLGAYVSALNTCDFCHYEHEATAEAFGVEEGILAKIIEDIDSSPLTENEKPLFHFAKKLTDEPHKMMQKDADSLYSVGWDDSALYHLSSLVGLFALNNRIISGLGIPPHDKDKLHSTAQRLKEKGYTSTLEYIQGKW